MTNTWWACGAFSKLRCQPQAISNCENVPDLESTSTRMPVKVYRWQNRLIICWLDQEKHHNVREAATAITAKLREHHQKRGIPQDVQNRYSKTVVENAIKYLARVTRCDVNLFVTRGPSGCGFREENIKYTRGETSLTRQRRDNGREHAERRRIARDQAPDSTKNETPVAPNGLGDERYGRDLVVETQAPSKEPGLVQGQLGPLTTLHTPKTTKRKPCEPVARDLASDGITEAVKPISPQPLTKTPSEARSQTSPTGESRGPDQNPTQPPRKKPRLGYPPTGDDHFDKSLRDLLCILGGIPCTDLNPLAFKYGYRETAGKIVQTSAVGTGADERKRLQPKARAGGTHDVTRRRGPRWKKPLTFPREGPQRETVDWDDLGRLENDEYLNDSLIAFYIRYLQERCQENGKRMHIFSTFFYETLTQTVGSKAGAGRINYGGVASWTKKVNLFEKDYVVVPVNEKVHWYVMIICNLRALVNAPVPPENNESAVDIQPPLLNATVDNDLRDVLESDVVTSYPATDDANGEDIEAGLPNGFERRRSGRRKQKERDLRKYDMHEPVVITLDSLGLNRSPTASVLKDYLVREAKEKYDMDIVKERIEDTTAERIPRQGNKFDCGLYLCMYLEQFLASPEAFTRSVLRRDSGALKWPTRVPSAALRQRFYDLLTELYSEQQGNGPAQVPNVGRILIREKDFFKLKTEPIQ